MIDRLITVFGASGFIGRYVVRALARDGFRIRAGVRNPATAHFLRPFGAVGQIQITQANARVPDTVARASEGAWGVVNLIGTINQSGPKSFYGLHVDAARNIAAAAARGGATPVSAATAPQVEADGL